MKRIIITFIFIFSLLMIYQPSSYAGSMMYGIGTLTCGKYIQETQHRYRSKRTVAQAQFTAWLNGYFTAMSVEKGKDLKQGKDLAALNLWVDNYCKKNPLKTYYAAVTKLQLELNKEEDENKTDSSVKTAQK